MWTTKKPVADAARRRKLAAGVTVLVVAVVAIVAWLGMSLISFFQEDGGPSGPKLNLGQTVTSQPQQPSKPPPEQAPAGPVQPAAIKLYNPGSTGDSPQDAPKAIDGDPATIWRTDKYRQQLPALKPGLGLLVSFDAPVRLSEVKITADSPGTAIEIRVAESTSPQLSLTRTVGSGTHNAVRSTVPLVQPVQAQHVIVWLTKLSPTDDGQFRSEIGELQFIAAK